MDINPDIIEDRVKEIKPDNVTFLTGNSYKIGEAFTDDLLKSFSHPWLVIDDAHKNVLGVLEHFGEHMVSGDYFVVEDGHPNLPSHLGAGRIFQKEYKPTGTVFLDQIRAFLTKHEKRFAVDSYFTDFFGYNGTWNWNGFIRCM